jgi:hypothetical protein
MVLAGGFIVIDFEGVNLCIIEICTCRIVCQSIRIKRISFMMVCELMSFMALIEELFCT